MTTTNTGRPDPRLLVPATALPFVPEGARVWKGDRCGTVIGNGRHFAAGASVWVAWPDWPSTVVLARDLDVDLSPPSLRNGLPERLDLEGFALRVLHPEAVSVCHMNSHVRAVVLNLGFGAEHVVSLGEAWPDLTGLTPDAARRAVLAAALRAREVGSV